MFIAPGARLTITPSYITNLFVLLLLITRYSLQP
jgi:hypothetical protein